MIQPSAIVEPSMNHGRVNRQHSVATLNSLQTNKLQILLVQSHLFPKVFWLNPVRSP